MVRSQLKTTQVQIANPAAQMMQQQQIQQQHQQQHQQPHPLQGEQLRLFTFKIFKCFKSFRLEIGKLDKIKFDKYYSIM
jgi:hypothetical protein